MRRHSRLLIRLAGGLLLTMPGTWLEAEEHELTVGDRAIRDLIGVEAVTVPLWPGEAPDEVRAIEPEMTFKSERKEDSLAITNVTHPTMTICVPRGAPEATAAVVVCPGGGYGSLGVEIGGTEIVRWLNSFGVAGIVLKYRVPKRHEGYAMHHHALQDAQRAMGILRQRAREWNVDPSRIGILGFSAGGHLAATLSNNFEKRTYKAVDAADQLVCRPDFVILVSAAYLTDPIDSDELDKFQHEEQIARGRTPPTFLAIAWPDKFTRGTTRYFSALVRAKVPVEYHAYNGGGHANGLRSAPLSRWGDASQQWMRDSGLIK